MIFTINSYLSKKKSIQIRCILQVEVHGPGIQSEGLGKDKPTHFIVDARKAGQAALEVAIQDAAGKDVPVRLDDKRDGTVQANYVPTSGSQHMVMVRLEHSFL